MFKLIRNHGIHFTHISIYIAIAIIYIILAIEYADEKTKIYKDSKINKKGEPKKHYIIISSLYGLLGLLGVYEMVNKH